jgi:S1-C subfamily serine protease
MRAALILLLLSFAGCARMPLEEARGTPVEAVARAGFARLSLGGVPVGSAVAVAPDRLLTNAHVVPEGVEIVGFRRGDGGAEGAARVVARSGRMDLVVLAVPAVFEPVSPGGTVRAGDRVWAAGAPAAGAAVSDGVVLRPRVRLVGHGPGFTARLGALLGYSGGPAVDAEGRLVGIVTALPQAGAAPLLAALAGVDVAGIANPGREVFVLGVGEVMGEVGRLEESLR